MAIITEDQEGRRSVLLTERRSIWCTKLRENNPSSPRKMRDSDTESCLMKDVPRSAGRDVGIPRQGHLSEGAGIRTLH